MIRECLRQPTLLCCFSLAFFKAALYVDGQNLIDAMMMTLYPKMLGVYFQKQQEAMAKI